MKRLNKEFKINCNNNINISFGTTNRNNPSVIYVSGNCWIKPTIDKLDYSKELNVIESNLKKNLKQFVTSSSQFDTKFICYFDAKLSGIKNDKKSFISFEYYLKQKDDNISSCKTLSPVIEESAKYISNNMLNDLAEFEFDVSKTKKK